MTKPVDAAKPAVPAVPARSLPVASPVLPAVDRPAAKIPGLLLLPVPVNLPVTVPTPPTSLPQLP